MTYTTNIQMSAAVCQTLPLYILYYVHLQNTKQIHCLMYSPGQEEADVLHVTAQRKHRAVDTERQHHQHLIHGQYISVLVLCDQYFLSNLPENTGECICSQVMDKHKVSQAG